MLEDYYDKIRSQLDRLLRDVPRPNILTLGITGAGKSTLINHAFGNIVAATGHAKPVTEEITFYDSPECGLGIFDSKGYEFGKNGEESYFQSTIAFAANSTLEGIRRGVHLVWYCIPAESERIHPIDVKTIDYFRNAGHSVASILTKCDQLSLVKAIRFAKLVKDQIGAETPMFKVSTAGNDSYELQNLCDWSASVLPDALRLAFTRAQRLELALKKEQAMKVVRAFQAEGTNRGFALFNEADEHALGDAVSRMAAKILYIYDLEELRQTLSRVGHLVSQGEQLMAFVARLVEVSTEVIGYLVADSHGREVGRFVGGLLGNYSRSITSQKLIEAVGLSIVSVCSSLAEQAVSSKSTLQNLSVAQIEDRFVTEVRTRLGN